MSKNKFYASKDILWSRHTAFYLPKASPLKASIKYGVKGDRVAITCHVNSLWVGWSGI